MVEKLDTEGRCLHRLQYESPGFRNVKIFEGENGRGLVAKKKYAKDSIVIEDLPLISMQHIFSRRLTKCCFRCMRPLGDLVDCLHRVLQEDESVNLLDELELYLDRYEQFKEEFRAETYGGDAELGSRIRHTMDSSNQSMTNFSFEPHVGWNCFMGFQELPNTGEVITIEKMPEKRKKIRRNKESDDEDSDDKCMLIKRNSESDARPKSSPTRFQGSYPLLRKYLNQYVPASKTSCLEPVSCVNHCGEHFCSDCHNMLFPEESDVEICDRQKDIQCGDREYRIQCMAKKGECVVRKFESKFQAKEHYDCDSKTVDECESKTISPRSKREREENREDTPGKRRHISSSPESSSSSTSIPMDSSVESNDGETTVSGRLESGSLVKPDTTSSVQQVLRDSCRKTRSRQASLDRSRLLIHLMLCKNSSFLKFRKHALFVVQQETFLLACFSLVHMAMLYLFEGWSVLDAIEEYAIGFQTSETDWWEHVDNNNDYLEKDDRPPIPYEPESESDSSSSSSSSSSGESNNSEDEDKNANGGRNGKTRESKNVESNGRATGATDGKAHKKKSNKKKKKGEGTPKFPKTIHKPPLTSPQKKVQERKEELERGYAMLKDIFLSHESLEAMHRNFRNYQACHNLELGITKDDQERMKWSTVDNDQQSNDCPKDATGGACKQQNENQQLVKKSRLDFHLLQDKLRFFWRHIDLAFLSKLLLQFDFVNVNFMQTHPMNEILRDVYSSGVEVDNRSRGEKEIVAEESESFFDKLERLLEDKKEKKFGVLEFEDMVENGEIISEKFIILMAILPVIIEVDKICKGNDETSSSEDEDHNEDVSDEEGGEGNDKSDGKQPDMKNREDPPIKSSPVDEVEQDRHLATILPPQHRASSVTGMIDQKTLCFRRPPGQARILRQLKCKDLLKYESILVSKLEDEEGPLPDLLGISLVRSISFLNHSCDPNLEVEYVRDRNDVSIRAIRDIRKNEEVTISYIDESLPLAIRRKRLTSMYNFECYCQKCRVQQTILTWRQRDTIKSELDDVLPGGIQIKREVETTTEKLHAAMQETFRYVSGEPHEDNGLETIPEEEEGETNPLVSSISGLASSVVASVSRMVTTDTTQEDPSKNDDESPLKNWHPPLTMPQLERIDGKIITGDIAAFDDTTDKLLSQPAKFLKPSEKIHLGSSICSTASGIGNGSETGSLSGSSIAKGITDGIKGAGTNGATSPNCNGGNGEGSTGVDKKHVTFGDTVDPGPSVITVNPVEEEEPAFLQNTKHANGFYYPTVKYISKVCMISKQTATRLLELCQNEEIIESIDIENETGRIIAHRYNSGNDVIKPSADAADLFNLVTIN